MLQLLTRVTIADNSGATKGQLIKVLKPKNSKVAKIGSVFLVAIKRNISHSKIRKGSMSKACLIRSNIKTKSLSNSLKWDENRIILVKYAVKGKDLLPSGSRFKGPISSTIRCINGSKKIVSVAKRSI
jgi:large subunit ribosomal protein L14|tara:strand:+ start:874 stop:1257 length:384 start_codon:yes stop_codon:yes gene_type:complete